ncbi:hypothetical protein LWI28_001416 [Acer negundo]|uniref:Uncharacterized protein n=1 Tax=Acer negundo TaxID=4023 RepID=A0AAD5IS10_ACENE|nr:hypothetical protein LWI28_001416 [Acer negundo]
MGGGFSLPHPLPEEIRPPPPMSPVDLVKSCSWPEMPIEMPKGLLFSVDTFTPTSRSIVAEIKSSGFRFKPKAVNFHDKPCQINNREIDFQDNSVELSSEEFHDDFDAESILDEEIEQGII